MELSIRKDNSWVAWRNRLLADPGVQRAMLRLPGLRWLVQSKARTMFDRVAGFAYSQILAAAIELDLFERLRAAPATTDELATEWAMPVAGAERLLRALAALDLVEPLSGQMSQPWTLAPDGAALLGNPGIAAMIAHHRLLYADLADPVALLRRGGGGGALQGFWHYARDAGQGPEGAVSDYSRLMAASQPLVAELVIGAYRFARHRAMLDVGGGEGAFAAAVARAVPGLAIGLFDLPEVGKRAAARIEAAGLGARVQVHGGSFLGDPLPRGHDLITLVRVLHDHDDAPALALLRAVRAALPPGGRLVIAEPMAGARGAKRMGDAYFGLYLWAMGSGRPRRPDEIGALLGEAGFKTWRRRPTALPLNAQLVIAGVE
ncbi:MAG: methyltransferase [Proteobacteria bacterium SG_bin5]|nr:methyltransferase [Sphingomonas sp.]OQW43775.1 MAG: methyltransferase [Proteobacteria bacterium SG_bin5]